MIQDIFSGLDFFSDCFPVVLALIRGVKASRGCVDCTAEAFSESSALHGFNLRDSVNAEGDNDEQ